MSLLHHFIPFGFNFVWHNQDRSFDHQNPLSSPMCPSKWLKQIWRNPLKVFLRHQIHKTDLKPSNKKRLNFMQVTFICQRLYWKSQLIKPLVQMSCRQTTENQITQLTRLADMEYWPKHKLNCYLVLKHQCYLEEYLLTVRDPKQTQPRQTQTVRLQSRHEKHSMEKPWKPKRWIEYVILDIESHCAVLLRQMSSFKNNIRKEIQIL